MKSNKFYSILVNGVITKDEKILISKRSHEERHQPGKWTVPGGKVENYENEEEISNILEKTLEREIMEEVGINIKKDIHLISNNTFKHSDGHVVLSLVFLCEYQSGEAQAFEDTIDTRWIKSTEINDFDFALNVKDYIARGFALLPYIIRRNTKAKKMDNLLSGRAT